jgi:RNA polymerase sigma-70 factor, ECF subfamily
MVGEGPDMPKECEWSRAESSPIVHLWLTRRVELERICLHWSRGCRSDAEDLLSDALTRALEAAPEADALSSPRAWLAAIIANLGRDRWRRASQEVPLDCQSHPDALIVDRALCDDALDTRRELARLLGRESGLTSAQRHILFGRCMGESYRDIAQSLEITESLARKLAQQARVQLRACLDTPET